MWKKLLTSVFTGVLLFSLSVCNVLAAEQEGTTKKQAYTYRVTIFAGNQGIFSGTEGLVLSNENAVVTQTEDKIIISGLNFGDEVAYTAQADVKLDSASKYYVQGIRLSGRDNDTVAASAFIVGGDADYVVAYGIKGNQVSYTVNYYDINGDSLLSSETFYGNVGDKPVIACKYVDGFAPQASGLTKTLKEDAKENVLTFVYTKIPGSTVEDVVTTVVENEYVDVVQSIVERNTTDTGRTDAEGAGTAGENREGGTAGENGQAGSAEGNPENDTTDDNDENGIGNGSAEAGGENGTSDEEDLIIDLDDEEVPLANMGSEGNGSLDISMMKYVVVIAVAVIALLILLVTAVVMRKRDIDSNEEV